MRNEWRVVTKHDIKYCSVFVLSVIFSVIGVWHAANHNCQDGGRGGAVAVAAAFFTLFLRKDFGRKAYETVAVEVPAAKIELSQLMESMFPRSTSSVQGEAISNLTARLDGILYAISINSDGQTRQNWWLAGASIQGTLVWGFGDWISHSIQVHHIVFSCS